MALTAKSREDILKNIWHKLRFFRVTSFWAFWLWRLCQVLTVLGSAGASVAAALVSKDHPYAKYDAIISSAVATVAATLLATMKFGENHRVRDIGHIGISAIYEELSFYFKSVEIGHEDLDYVKGRLANVSEIEFDQVALLRSLEVASSVGNPH